MKVIRILLLCALLCVLGATCALLILSVSDRCGLSSQMVHQGESSHRVRRQFFSFRTYSSHIFRRRTHKNGVRLGLGRCLLCQCSSCRSHEGGTSQALVVGCGGRCSHRNSECARRENHHGRSHVEDIACVSYSYI